MWRRLALNILVRASSALLLSAQRFAFFSLFSIPVLSTHYIPLFNWRKKEAERCKTRSKSDAINCESYVCEERKLVSIVFDDSILSFSRQNPTKSESCWVPSGGNLTTEFSPLTMRRNRKFDGNSIPNNEQMSIVAFGGDSCSSLSPHSQFIKL